MGRQTVTTTEREYDADGRLVKETVTETVAEWADQPVMQPVPLVEPYVPHPQPMYPWWQPSITTCQSQTSGTPDPNIYVTVNSDADPAAIAKEIGLHLRRCPA